MREDPNEEETKKVGAVMRIGKLAQGSQENWEVWELGHINQRKSQKFVETNDGYILLGIARQLWEIGHTSYCVEFFRKGFFPIIDFYKFD